MGLLVYQCPRATAWLQPGKVALPMPCMCLEFPPPQPSVAFSSINLILPNLPSCCFLFSLLVLDF